MDRSRPRLRTSTYLKKGTSKGTHETEGTLNIKAKS